jgi:hypothetical protein
MYLPAISILEYVRKIPPKDTFIFRLLDSRTVKNYSCYAAQSLVLSYDILSIYYSQEKTSNISTIIQKYFSTFFTVILFGNCQIFSLKETAIFWTEYEINRVSAESVSRQTHRMH